jgi:CubicO group peptidase (beta-lactamase class C family)
MMLHEQGRLDLDDPLARFIPCLCSPQVFASFNPEDASYTSRPAATEITIRHLLNHTSGYGYAFSNPILFALEQATGQSPTELPLLHDPGTQWTYGVGTAILGDVIRAITGMDLYAFFKAELFEPLGMSDTFYRVPPEKRARVTTYHQRRRKDLVEVPNPQDIGYPETGSGNLLSTAPDYLRFLQMLLNRGAAQGRQLLHEDSVLRMTRNQIGDLSVEIQPAADASKCRPFMLRAKQDKFGLGFQLAGPASSKLALRSQGSYSWAGLYNTYFWVDPRQELIVVILMQMLPFYDIACRNLCMDIEKTIYGHLE